MDIITVLNAMRKAYDRILFFPEESPRRKRANRQFWVFRGWIIKRDVRLQIELSNKNFEAEFWRKECEKLEAE